jgi:RHS repeat-associated protein
VNTCLAATDTTYKFTGLERDSESNLDHTLFRQNSSTLGRWMTPDPGGLAVADLSNPQSWNRYGYVLNNPGRFVDWFGLCGTGVSSTIISGDGTTSSGGSEDSGPCRPRLLPLDPPFPDQTVTSFMAPMIQLSVDASGGSNNSGPVVPANPCKYQGRALSPSDYATSGNAAKWYSLNFLLDAVKGWRTGHYLDAQPLTNVPYTWRAAAYGNYVYGVYMKGASVPVSMALRGAEAYALTKTYPVGTPMQPFYPGLPAANAANITNGYSAQANGTACSTPPPAPPPPQAK